MTNWITDENPPINRDYIVTVEVHGHRDLCKLFWADNQWVGAERIFFIGGDYDVVAWTYPKTYNGPAGKFKCRPYKKDFHSICQVCHKTNTLMMGINEIQCSACGMIL